MALSSADRLNLDQYTNYSHVFYGFYSPVGSLRVGTLV